MMNGTLPDYYISTADAKELGWNGEDNLHVVANGKQIGGDRFYDYGKKLPFAVGRIWYEADINYKQGTRNKHRIVYSNDGLVFVTYDLYETFFEIVGVAGNKKVNPQTGDSTRYSNLQDAKDDYGGEASLLDIVKKAREMGGGSTGGGSTIEPDSSTNTYYESILKQYEVNGIEYKEVYQHESGRAIITTSKKVNGKWEYVSSRPYSKEGTGDSTIIPGKQMMSNNGLLFLGKLETEGSKYNVYDSAGNLTGIYSADIGDGGITFGFGHYVKYGDTDKQKQLNELYGLEFKEGVLVPIDLAVNIKLDDVSENKIDNVKTLDKFIEDNNILFTQNQYDALVAMAFLRRIPSELKELILQKNKNNMLYEDYKEEFYNIVLNDFKSIPTFNKYGDGWTSRIKNELDVYFNNDYGKKY